MIEYNQPQIQRKEATSVKTQVLAKEQVASQEQQLNDCILRSQNYLLNAQFKEGYWNSELLVDPLTICDYILFMRWRGTPNVEVENSAACQLLKEQNTDGGWGQYNGGRFPPGS